MSIGSLSGDGFHEGAFTLEGYEKGIENTFGKTKKNFYSEYYRKLQEAHFVAKSAKVYIIKNWEKVDDWSELNVTVYDRDNEEKVEFYNHDNYQPTELSDEASDVVKDAFKRVEKRREEKHNPVESFDEPVLDTVDGDFSVTINGQDFLWIRDEAVIQIAHYIEYKLEEKKDG